MSTAASLPRKGLFLLAVLAGAAWAAPALGSDRAVLCNRTPYRWLVRPLQKSLGDVGSVTITITADSPKGRQNTHYLVQWSPGNEPHVSLLPDPDASLKGGSLELPAGGRLTFTDATPWYSDLHLLFELRRDSEDAEGSVPLLGWLHYHAHMPHGGPDACETYRDCQGTDQRERLRRHYLNRKRAWLDLDLRPLHQPSPLRVRQRANGERVLTLANPGPAAAEPPQAEALPSSPPSGTGSVAEPGENPSGRGVACVIL